jgi:hypothetical protein
MPVIAFIVQTKARVREFILKGFRFLHVTLRRWRRVYCSRHGITVRISYVGTTYSKRIRIVFATIFLVFPFLLRQFYLDVIYKCSHIELIVECRI